MKHLLLSTLLLVGLQARAQKPQAVAQTKRQTPDMLGIGPFKIGQTTPTDVAQLCAKAKISLQESYSLHATRDAGDSLVAFQVPYESPDDYPDASDFASPNPQVSVVYFPEYTVTDIRITELVLRFYKGVLFEIIAMQPGDLPEAFKLKYGKPELRSLVTPTTCTYKLSGRNVLYKDESFFERWYNGGIVALSYLGSYRDSNCTKQSNASFSVRNEVQAKAIQAKEELAVKAQQTQRDATRRKKLSEL